MTDNQPREANRPHTPLRSIRVDDQLWSQSVATFGERGVSEAIRGALARLVAEGLNDRPDPATHLIEWQGMGLDPVTLTEGPEAYRERTYTFRAYARSGRTRSGWALESEPVTLSGDDFRALRAEYPEAFTAKTKTANNNTERSNK